MKANYFLKILIGCLVVAATSICVNAQESPREAKILESEQQRLELEKKKIDQEQKTLERERKEAKERMKDLLGAQNKANASGNKAAAQKAREDLIQEIANSQSIRAKIDTSKFDLETIDQQLGAITKQLGQLREKPVTKPIEQRTLVKLLQDITQEIKLLPSRVKQWFIQRTGQPDTAKMYVDSLTEVMKIEADKPFTTWAERESARKAQLAARRGSTTYDTLYNSKLAQFERAKTDYLNQKIANYRDDSEQLQQDFALLANQRRINTDPQMPLDRLVAKQREANLWKQQQPSDIFSGLFNELTQDKVFEDILGRKNPYTILGIDQNASSAQIEKAYAELSKNNPTDELNEAYAYLTSIDLRNLVDSTLDFSRTISNEMSTNVKRDIQQKFITQSDSILSELNQIIKDRQSGTTQPNNGPDIPPL
ncbi:MAG TPA: hypothetical protein VHO47_03605 [Candidatus Babeliales bacterium]|nr:hypothetical protein [Candidatus Babeliales bacterium]